MYISDYGYAYENGWASKVVHSRDKSSLYNNWMQLGVWEWTITREAVSACVVVPLVYGSEEFSDGFGATFFTFAIRPVFNLTADTTYKSGTGTKSDPITINLD